MAFVFRSQTVAGLLCNENSFPCKTESAEEGMDFRENVDSLYRQSWHYSQKEEELQPAIIAIVSSPLLENPLHFLKQGHAITFV